MNKLDRIDPKLLATNPRATLASWLKYETTVLAAFRQHPKTFIYRPANMAASSVCTKMRDAIRGRLAFDYPSEVFRDDLARWYSEVVFKHDATNVYIGPMQEIKDVLSGEAASDAKAVYSYPELSFEELNAFLVLLSNSRIYGPVIIKQPPDISLLPFRPNTQTLQQKDGSLVLL